MVAERRTVGPFESTDTDVEPIAASTCDSVGATLAPVLVEATGVVLELDTETFEGVALTLDWVETGGADTVVEAVAAGGEALALVVTVVLALVVTVALAAGVLTVAVVVAEGVDGTDALTEAETLAVAGNAGTPSACAGTAKDRQAAAETAAQLAKRNACLRGITLTRFSDYLTEK